MPPSDAELSGQVNSQIEKEIYQKCRPYSQT